MTKVIKHKVGLLNLAEELGNVSKDWYTERSLYNNCMMVIDHLLLG